MAQNPNKNKSNTASENIWTGKTYKPGTDPGLPLMDNLQNKARASKLNNKNKDSKLEALLNAPDNKKITEVPRQKNFQGVSEIGRLSPEEMVEKQKATEYSKQTVSIPKKIKKAAPQWAIVDSRLEAGITDERLYEDLNADGVYYAVKKQKLNGLRDSDKEINDLVNSDIEFDVTDGYVTDESGAAIPLVTSKRTIKKWETNIDLAKKTLSKELKVDINKLNADDVIKKAKDITKSKLINEKLEEIERIEGEKIEDVFGEDLGLIKGFIGLPNTNDKYKKIRNEVAEKAKKEIESVKDIRDKKAGELVNKFKALESERSEIQKKLKDTYNIYLKDKTAITKEMAEKYNYNLKLDKALESQSKKAQSDYFDYLEKLDKDLTLPTLQSIADNAKRSYSFAEEIPGRIISSGTDILSGLSKLRSEFSATPMEKIIFQNAAVELNKFSKETTESISKPQEFSKINSVADVFQFGTDLIAGQVVNTAITGTTGGVGLALVSGAAAGNKMLEMDEEIASTGIKYSALQYYGAATIAGLAEYVTEKLALDNFNIGKKALKNAFEINGKYTLEAFDFFDTAKKWAWNTNSEGTAELLSQFANNFSNKYLLEKDEVSLLDGLTDSYISGAFMAGAVFQAPVVASVMYKTYASDSNHNERLKNEKLMLSLGGSLEALNSKEFKTEEDIKNIKEVVAKIDGLAAKNIELNKEVERTVDNLSNADKATIRKMSIETAKLKDEIDTINADETLDSETKKSLIEAKAKKIDQNSLVKHAIIKRNAFSKDKAKAQQFVKAAAAITGNETKNIFANSIDDLEESVLSEINKLGLTSDEYNNAVNALKADISEIKSEYVKEPNAIISGAILTRTTQAAGKGSLNIYLESEVAKMGGDISVLSHEIGHSDITSKLFAGDNDAINLVNEMVKFAEQKLGKIASDAINKTRETYKGNPENVIADELFQTVTSLLRNKNVKPDQGLIGKLNKLVKSIFPVDHFSVLPENIGEMLYGAITQLERDERYHTYEGTRVPKIMINTNDDIMKHRLSSRPMPKPHDVDAWATYKVR